MWRIYRWVAWHLSKSIVYWCGMKMMANATTGIWSKQEVPSLLAMEMFVRWDIDNSDKVTALNNYLGG